MDKIEHYLDMVCRGIGGPRALRIHLRQELREHLLDAAAEHRAAGLSEEQALDRALEDFGGPEQVRAELEAMHGHRLMAVLIDKAMQWKELTMKAKWLWTATAHLLLAAVILTEVALIAGILVLLMPKQMQYYQEGWIGSGNVEAWGISFLGFLVMAADNWLLWVVPLGLAWLVFEWRVRSENKPLIRLSALGTVALALAVVVGLTTAALALPLMLALGENYARLPEPVVREQMAVVEAEAGAMEKSWRTNDWEAMQSQIVRARHAADTLARMGAAAPTLTAMREQAKVDALRVQLKAARDSLHQVQNAVYEKDSARLEAALKSFNEAYRDVREGK
jgi:hypothetical protein